MLHAHTGATGRRCWSALLAAVDVGELVASGVVQAAACSCTKDVMEHVGPLSATEEVRPHLSANGRATSNCSRLARREVTVATALLRSPPLSGAEAPRTKSPAPLSPSPERERQEPKIRAPLSPSARLALRNQWSCSTAATTSTPCAPSRPPPRTTTATAGSSCIRSARRCTRRGRRTCSARSTDGRTDGATRRQRPCWQIGSRLASAATASPCATYTASACSPSSWDRGTTSCWMPWPLPRVRPAWCKSSPRETPCLPFQFQNQIFW